MQRPSATLRYTVYGALFGLLFPAFSTILDLLFQGLPLTLESLLSVQRASPLHWVIDTAPLFLGLFAALAGRRQDALARLNEQLEERDRERGQVLHELESLRRDLEERVAERSADLTTVIEVGRASASILELGRLCREVVALVRERFDLYYTGLFLLDPAGEYALLEAGTGEPGRIMKEQGHRLKVGGRSMVGAACAGRAARVALDVGNEPVRFDNPHLPRTRSEAALPLIVGERVLGALDVQSTQPAAFETEGIALLQLVADQVAVAVDNARRLSEESELLEATSPLFRISRRLSTATSTAEVAEAIVASVRETEADGCAVARVETGLAGSAEAMAFLADWRREDRHRPAPAAFPRSVPRSMMVIEDMAQSEQLPESSRSMLLETGTQALVILPLRLGGRSLGFVAIDRGKPGPFSPVTLRLYEILAEQSAAALDRARLLEESQGQAWREHALRSISDRITASFDLDSLLREALEQTGRLVGAAGGYVELGTAEDREIQ
ncbi:MAG: GAF domain-containing protein [Anaerolineae bacterium]|nr:GAF domain-containing protein [Anaerolineae bacterium]